MKNKRNERSRAFKFQSNEGHKTGLSNLGEELESTEFLSSGKTGSGDSDPVANI